MDRDEYNKHRSVGCLFRARVLENGDRTMLKFKDSKSCEWNNLSWNQVSQQVNNVSYALLSLGVKEHELIGICAPNYYMWSIADYAIYGFRGVSIPIYPTSSLSQIKYIINETEMRSIFVGNQDQYNKIIELDSKIDRIIVFDTDTDLKGDSRAIYFADLLKIGEQNSAEYSKVVDNHLAQATKDDISTIIYTSGTTGEPKGVILHNSNFFSAYRMHDKRVKVDSNDSSLSFLPLSHVYERSWVYYVMHRSAVVYYMTEAKDVVNTMQEVKPTMMCTVPRFYEKIYEGIWEKVSTWSSTKQNIVKWAVNVGKRYSYRKKEDKTIYLILSIKHKIAKKLVFDKINSVLGGNLRLSPCGGASLSPKIVEFFHSIGLMINNGYGLSETTATVACYPETGYEYDSVGKIMPGVEVLINEDNEILVKGDSVFHGYYKKEEATKEVFDGGWFKTGDAGMFTEKGNLRITDRIKDIIKTSGGKYVAPQLLESMLSHSIYINQVAVIGNKQKYISALIVPEMNKVKQYAQQNNINFNSDEELLKLPQIINLISDEIAILCVDLAPFERVVKFTLLNKEFTIEHGELTATLKIRRKAINMMYKDKIELMYS